MNPYTQKLFKKRVTAWRWRASVSIDPLFLMPAFLMCTTSFLTYSHLKNVNFGSPFIVGNWVWYTLGSSSRVAGITLRCWHRGYPPWVREFFPRLPSPAQGKSNVGADSWTIFLFQRFSIWVEKGAEDGSDAYYLQSVRHDKSSLHIEFPMLGQ